MDNDLQKLRHEIDMVNEALVASLNKRAEIAKRIGKVKQGKHVYRPARESEVLSQVRRLNTGPFPQEAMERVFREIIGACRNLESQLRVSYLGPEGTYSEEAARQFAGSTSVFMPFPTIDDAVSATQNAAADIAIVPVENSTEGSVNRTLDLLLNTELKIVGEIALPIHHQLLCRQRDLARIKEVTAHPQALAQCRQWLAQNLPHARQIAASSNADAAKHAAKSDTKAAIASALAAGLYGLRIVGADIEDDHRNTTRFLALGTQETPSTGRDKTSLVCSVPNRAGSLHELLGIFTSHGINMTKLESRPANNALWDYTFYIDLEGHEADPDIAKAIRQVRNHTTMVKILGSYPRASGANS